jgi:hypothetical protein
MEVSRDRRPWQFSLTVLAPLRWLFILEGAITIFAAGVSMFILPDYPAT